ncbi:helix-turn-helix domain-containing protein [Marinifilum sp. D737]|uniref:helix-turn-helix domain-containing protein n=1 Tax=Marinifilum sp. D737 TaxID=2969628 RepID=UPI002272A7A7|nr:helix-turn-helix domain-containing protein [Marinifilum sp. D737]MCY1635763.1 hypothetical protein [Marinifilum sp. D737]
MEYRTMNRKELAAELDISYATLYRRMKLLDPEFRKAITGKSLLLENQVRYIHEQISGLKKWGSGSK